MNGWRIKLLCRISVNVCVMLHSTNRVQGIVQEKTVYPGDIENMERTALTFQFCARSTWAGTFQRLSRFRRIEFHTILKTHMYLDLSATMRSPACSRVDPVCFHPVSQCGYFRFAEFPTLYNDADQLSARDHKTIHWITRQEILTGLENSAPLHFSKGRLASITLDY